MTRTTQFWRWLGTPPGRRTVGGIVVGVVALKAIGLAIRYVTHSVAPRYFDHDEHFPALARVPKRTSDHRGRKGDPVNVAFVGTAKEITRAFLKAGWRRPAPIDRRDDERLVESILFRRQDPNAPMSPMFLYGRSQDLAFECEAGRTAGRRHHIRLWHTDLTDPAEHRRPVWIGGATFDVRTGFIIHQLAPTHHVGADIDRERQFVFRALAAVGQLEEWFHVTGIGIRVAARNAAGDRFDTDGELSVGVIPRHNGHRVAPRVLADPPRVARKNRWWAMVHRDAVEDPSRWRDARWEEPV